MLLAVILFAIASAATGLKVHDIEIASASATIVKTIRAGEFVHFHWQLDVNLSLVGPVDESKPWLYAPVLHEASSQGDIVQQFNDYGRAEYRSAKGTDVSIIILVLPPPSTCQLLRNGKFAEGFKRDFRPTTTENRDAIAYITLGDAAGADDTQDIKVYTKFGTNDVTLTLNAPYVERTDTSSSVKISVSAENSEATLKVYFCEPCLGGETAAQGDTCPNSTFAPGLDPGFQLTEAEADTIIDVMSMADQTVDVLMGSVVAIDVPADQYVIAKDSPGNRPMLLLPVSTRTERYYWTVYRLPENNARTIKAQLDGFSFVIRVRSPHCWTAPAFTADQGSFAPGPDGSIVLSTAEPEGINISTTIPVVPGMDYQINMTYTSKVPQGFFQLDVGLTGGLNEAAWSSSTSFTRSFRSNDSPPMIRVVILDSPVSMTVEGNVTLALSTRAVSSPASSDQNLTLSPHPEICWACNADGIYDGTCQNGARTISAGDNGCVYNAAAAGSPCTADACDASAGLTSDCCAVITTYCASNVDPGCMSLIGRYSLAVCKNERVSVTGAITFSNLPGAVVQQLADMVAGQQPANARLAAEIALLKSGLEDYLQILLVTTNPVTIELPELTTVPEVLTTTSANLHWTVMTLNQSQADAVASQALKINVTALKLHLESFHNLAPTRTFNVADFDVKIATSSTINNSTTPAPGGNNPNNPSGSKSNDGPSGGVIAGAVVGGLLVIALAVGAVVVTRNRSNNKTASGLGQATSYSNPSYNADASTL